MNLFLSFLSILPLESCRLEPLLASSRYLIALTFLLYVHSTLDQETIRKALVLSRERERVYRMHDVRCWQRWHQTSTSKSTPRFGLALSLSLFPLHSPSPTDTRNQIHNGSFLCYSFSSFFDLLVLFVSL